MSDELVDALYRRASERMAAGAMAQAAADLDTVAEMHRSAGRTVEEARALAAAATTLRFGGDIAQALTRVERACALAPAGTPVRVSALTELGELRVLGGRPELAVDAYRDALEHGRRAGLLPFAQSALLRRIGQALALAGRAADVEPVLREAIELYEAAGRETDAQQTRVEAAVALAAAGRPAQAAIASARAAAGDDTLAELALLEAACAINAGDLDPAIAHLRAARQHALDGGVVVTYVAAAVALADLLERRGDRVGAYASLAVGWATSSDALGRDAATALFRPQVAALRQRLGHDAFAHVRDEYYAARLRAS
jgi:tetratricopeptide (TPR) repeat protein